MHAARPSRLPFQNALRAFALGTSALTLAIAATAPARAQSAGDARGFTIAAQPLLLALQQFTEQSGIQVGYSTTLGDGIRTQGVSGSYAPAEALSRLLAGTGLIYRFTSPSAVTLEPAPTADNGAVQLGPVRVAGDSAGTNTAIQGGNLRGPSSDPVAQALNPLTTVGSKVPVREREIPQSVTVLTQTQIRQQEFMTLDQALNRVTGIRVLTSDGQRFQYYSRGFPISSFQVDGAAIYSNPNMSGTASTSGPSLAIYDRVEILRGADGLFSGFGSPGGTINLVRKRAQDSLTIQGLANAGNQGQAGGQIDVGGPLNAAGTIRARVVGYYQDQNLTADTTWKHDRVAYGTIEADITPTTLLRVGASYSAMREHNTWVGSQTRSDGVRLPRSLYLGADWNRQWFHTTDAFAQVEQKLPGDWKLTLTGDYTHNRYQLASAEFVGRIDSDGNGRFGTTNKGAREDNQSYEINASGPFSLFGREHHLVVGANYLHMSERQISKYGPDGDDFFLTVQNINAIDFPKPVWPGTPANTDINSEWTNQYSAYANVRLSLADPLTLVGGASISWWHDRFRPDAVYNYDLYTPTNDRYDHKVIPYAALIYDVARHYSLYASYSKIFQPQSVRDSNGKLIPAIRGNQYEAGIKAEYLDGRLNASLAVFQLDQQNRALLDPAFPDDDFYLAQGKARSRGVEAHLSGEILPGWTVNGGYTYTHSKYLDDSVDASASNFSQISPKHLLRLWTNYAPPRQKWEVGAGLNATSRTYNETFAGTISQGSYATVDARVAYRLTDKITVAVNGTNLFDRHYYAAFGGTGNVFWGDPRRGLATLRLNY